jgi:hypothetical protein
MQIPHLRSLNRCQVFRAEKSIQGLHRDPGERPSDQVFREALLDASDTLLRAARPSDPIFNLETEKTFLKIDSLLPSQGRSDLRASSFGKVLRG